MTGLRPLLPEDIPAADEMGFAALRTAAQLYEPHSPPWPDRTPERVQLARSRIAHLQRTDPDGAWVAVAGDEPVGIALSLRRGSMWFLSLLAVATDLQSRGVGKSLLDASLRTSVGATTAWILATTDPKALRRYALAGFAPHPGYSASGPVDRSLLPAELGVREGDPGRDGQLVEDVVTELRGAPYGPDLEVIAATADLLVAEDGRARGFCWLGPRGIVSLGATTPALASRLLWEVLARSSGDVTVEWLTATQQWAIDVVLAARLPLLAGPSICVRSAAGPLTPYLPGGAYG